jgi:hypothetical protein
VEEQTNPTSPDAAPTAAPAAADSATPSESGDRKAESDKRKAVSGKQAGAVLAVIAVAGIMLSVLIARGGPPADVAAAPAATPAQPVAAAPAPEPAYTETWSRDAQWVGNLRKTVAFGVRAENTVAVWMRQVQPVLVVRCAANSPQVFVFTGSAMKIEPETDDHTVTLSLDDEPVRTERWPDSIEHDSLFAPDGAAFARRLSAARTMRFGFTPHNAEPAVARFHVSGLEDVLSSARECGRTKR